MNIIKISKALSYGLRHAPWKVFSKNVDKNGFIDIETVLFSLNISKEELQQVVYQNDKQRFEIVGDKIRARQGHSANVKVDLGLKEQIPPVSLFHGTSYDFQDSILKKGLMKMNRHHVHLSESIDTANNVGIRHAKTMNNLMLLHINAAKMVSKGFKFYKTDNNVWLTDHVPSEYIEILE